MLQYYAATLLSFWKTKQQKFRTAINSSPFSTYCTFIIFFCEIRTHKADRLTLYSKSEKSRPPLPPLNPPPLKPGGGPRGGAKEPLLSGRPRPPRGPMKPRPRKPPLPRLCLRGMPNVSEFILLSSAQVVLRSLTHKDRSGSIVVGNKHTSTKTFDIQGEAPQAEILILALNVNILCKTVFKIRTKSETTTNWCITVKPEVPPSTQLRKYATYLEYPLSPPLLKERKTRVL